MAIALPNWEDESNVSVNAFAEEHKSRSGSSTPKDVGRKTQEKATKTDTEDRLKFVGD